MDPGDGCPRLVPGRDHAAEAASLQARITVQDVCFWPKADISWCTAHVRFWGQSGHDLCENPLLRSLLGLKRTWFFAAHMSASDPKRTCCTGTAIVPVD